jgi:branched-chain amino acid transport system permease protein
LTGNSFVLYRETGQFKSSYAEDIAIFPLYQDRVAIKLLLLATFLLIPFLAKFQIWPLSTDYLLRAILIPFLVLSLAAIGVNVLVGYCGQVSLGSGAFMAIGAYCAYKFGTGIHLPAFWSEAGISIPPISPLLAILLGGAMSAVAGILFGIPSLRIKGLYLAVATLAAQFFFDWVFLRVKWFTNYTPSGSVNAPTLSLFGYELSTSVDRYCLCLASVTLGAFCVKNLVRGNIGRQWMAIRDMDIAAELMGIRPYYAKLSAFAVSSFVIGISGALWGFAHLGSWEPLAFSIDRSLQLLFMVIIGGMGSIAGSFLGAGFILILPILLETVPSQFGLPVSTEVIAHLQSITFGGLICLLLIKEPRGFARLIALFRQKIRLWPFPH